MYTMTAGYIRNDTIDETAPAVTQDATTAAANNCALVAFEVVGSWPEYTLEATVSVSRRGFLSSSSTWAVSDDIFVDCRC